MRSAPALAGPAPAPLLAAVAEADPLAGLDRAQVVIVNGVYEAELSDLAGIEGVTVESLAHVLATSPERVGRLVDDAGDMAVALNTALMQGGALITVAGGAAPARPIEIVHLTAADAPVSVYTRTVVNVGDDAAVRFVESHRGSVDLAYQVNALTEFDLGENARVTWARLQMESEAAQHIGTFIARLGARSELDHVAVNSGAALARWQGALTLAGKNVRIGFSGATMLSGTEHGDTTLVVTHGEPNQASRELYKAAVDGRATGAFQGKIVVEQRAQKTDARMMAKALLLSDDAEFASKPELEIFADDVQCGHGATAGQISDTELFYLMSRGIPRAEAERLLIEAFLDDAIDVAGDEAIGDALKGVVSAWLARRGA
jgi:Fe-S cluster assembly protein SufD